MEAISALNGQTQIPPARRRDSFTPSSQVPVEPEPPDEPNPAEEKPDRLVEFARSVGAALGDQLPANTRLQILQHEETGRFVYRAVDVETGEVVRQYPPDEILRMLAYWHDLKGMAVDTSA